MPKYDDDEVDNKRLKREREESDDESRKKSARRHRHDRDRRNSRERNSRHDQRERSPFDEYHRRDRSRENDRKYSDGARHGDKNRNHDDRHNHERNHHWEHKNDNQSRNPRNNHHSGRSKATWGKAEEETKKDNKLLDKDGKPIEKEKPNFEKSGKLTEHTNTFNGVVIKYNEPKDARMPKKKHWRLYPYKGSEALKILHLHRQSAYLLGRDRRVADIPLDHPSISQQHAVLQFRSVPFVRSDGVNTHVIHPYIIDLESSNGTFLNNEKIAERRFVELREGDMLKFGFSTREYMVMKDDTTEAVLDKLQVDSEESVEE